MVATIDKTAIAGKTRVEITDALVDEVMTKYKKTVREMIDTCPNDAKYADRRAEYIAKFEIANEYAPKIIDNADEIEKMILNFSCDNNIILTNSNRGAIMKSIMPFLKQNNCDMKIAQEILKRVIV